MIKIPYVYKKSKIMNRNCFQKNLIGKMTRIFILSLFFLLISFTRVFSQLSNDTTVYLLTCAPGTETYSIYGHSALRIVIPEEHIDTVYNWGVFDFDTPNFVWKFAKGRLDYLLIAEYSKVFLRDYLFEKRSVYSQKININAQETHKLIEFINENLKPDNRIPLLQNPEILLGFNAPVIKQKFFTAPPFIFTLVIILILILAALTKSRKIIWIIDIIIYSFFSILSILMIFFNFFTDHQQMKWNLNIIWLNPFIIICLVMLILNKTATIWFRVVFFISASFLVLHFILPQEFNLAFFLLTIILIIRSSVRSEFDWNPLTLK